MTGSNTNIIFFSACLVVWARSTQSKNTLVNYFLPFASKSKLEGRVTVRLDLPFFGSTTLHSACLAAVNQKSPLATRKSACESEPLSVALASVFNGGSSMPHVPDAERWHIIKLSIQKHSQRAITSTIGRPLKTVNTIIQAYRDEGRISEASHPCRPCSTTDDKDRLIMAAASQDLFQTAAQICDIGVDVHVSTVRCQLTEVSMRGRVAAQKPLLNQAQKTTRLQFAQAHKNWTPDDWARVIFTDESAFSTKQNQGRRVWRMRYER